MRKVFLLCGICLGVWSCEQRRGEPEKESPSRGRVLPLIPPETLAISDTLCRSIQAEKGFSFPARYRLISLQQGETFCDTVGGDSLLRLFWRRPTPYRETLPIPVQDYLEPVETLSYRMHIRPLMPWEAKAPLVFALERPTLLQQGFFPTYTYGSENGLSLDGPPIDMEEDKWGRVWFCTENGLYCWGGRMISGWTAEEGLPTGSVSRLEIDRQGRVWVSGIHGVACWDRGTFWQIPLASAGGAEPFVSHIAVEKDSMLWLGGKLGPVALLSWSKDTLYEWFSEKSPYLFPLCADSLGVWCAMYEKGVGFSVALLQQGKVSRLSGWRSPSAPREILWQHSLQCLWIATRAGLWCWERGQSTLVVEGAVRDLYLVDSTHIAGIWEGQWTLFSKNRVFVPPLKLPEAPLSAFLPRAQGEWVVGSEEGWIAVIDPQQAVSFPTSFFLPMKDWPYAFHAPGDGTLWVGMEHNGLLRLTPSGCAERWVIPPSTGLPPFEEIVFFYPEGDSMWMTWYGQGKQASAWFKPLQRQLLYPLSRASETWYARMPLGSQDVVAANPQQMAFLRGDSVCWVVPSLRPTTTFLRDRRGWVWIGGTDAVYSWTGTHLLRWPLPENRGFILALAEDSLGGIWVGTHTSGLYRWEGTHWRRWTRSQGLPDPLVSQLIWRDSVLLIGTAGGIACISPEDGLVASFQPAIGLGGQAGVNGGIFRKAGMVVESVIPFFPKQSWLIGMGSALFCLPLSSFGVEAIPSPYLHHLSVEGEVIGVDTPVPSKGIRWTGIETAPSLLPVGLSLPYGAGVLRFSFGYAGSFSLAYGVEYSFKLAGLGDEWSAPTRTPYVEYRGLPPGSYQFLLRARYPGGRWSQPVEYSFEVRAPWWLTGWAFGLYVAGLAAIVWGLIRWRTAILRARAEELAKQVAAATATIRAQNEELIQKNALLSEQNEIIAAQKADIEQKNADLVASITYARRIQRALVPPATALKAYFPDSFIFWRPRDIVSGDIYGLHALSFPQEEHLYLLVADCTGHGVPGAFMSLLSLALFSRGIVEQGISEPDILLNTISQQLATLLHADTSEHVRDGFEGVLMRFVWEEGCLRGTYVSARSPFWIVRGGEIQEQPYDPFPVGPPEVAQRANSTFILRTVELQRGDWLYFSTDGFPDQIGGPKGRKMWHKAYRSLLVELSHLSPEEQVQYAEKALESWRGPYPQIDDILLVGLRVP